MNILIIYSSINALNTRVVVVRRFVFECDHSNKIYGKKNIEYIVK